jgi:hypothetical protein
MFGDDTYGTEPLASLKDSVGDTTLGEPNARVDASSRNQRFEGEISNG